MRLPKSQCWGGDLELSADLTNRTQQIRNLPHTVQEYKTKTKKIKKTSKTPHPTVLLINLQVNESANKQM